MFKHLLLFVPNRAVCWPVLTKQQPIVDLSNTFLMVKLTPIAIKVYKS